jgi:hypothetical protein
MTIELIERDLITNSPNLPVKITVGRVVDGDLTPFRHRIEITNTNNNKTDSAMLTLRIPPDGTFVRTSPILVNESARNNYLIQMQIRQSDGAGGTRYSKAFRWNIGRPTIQDDVGAGETLVISLIPLEYGLKEHLASRQLILHTPRDAFSLRLIDYSFTRGLDNPSIIFSSDTIKLPGAAVLKQSYEPLQPTTTWDLLKQIVDRLANPSIAGGTFNDYFFEFEADAPGNDLDAGNVRVINATANEMGVIDSGITLDPLQLAPVDTERDKTIATDLIKIKNNIIFEGSPRGGSLPMEKARYTSDWVHGQARPPWNIGVEYSVDEVVKVDDFENDPVDPSEGRARFFVCVVDHTASSSNKPTAFTQRHWTEDFTTIALWDTTSEADQFDICSQVVGSDTRFFRANKYIAQNQGTPAVINTADWDEIGERFPKEQIRVPYFSYTPWTEDINIGKANLAGFGQVGAESVGLVPDWNLERANHDRVRATNQFEQISTKVVQSEVNDPSSLTASEINHGARFLINGIGGGEFAGHNNQVAEWNEPPSVVGSVGKWEFSKTPDANDELVTNLKSGRMMGWNTVLQQWESKWDVNTAGDVSSPFHSVYEISKATGSTGTFGQALKLRFQWNPSLIIANIEWLSSRGAWFVMHMPIPNQDFGGTDLGSVYKRSTLDARNLDFNAKGGFGWNDGLDTEDLGPISALTMKLKMDLIDVSGAPINGYSNMPFTCWAIDIFGRIWKTNFVLRRVGEYSFIRIVFGESSSMELYHNRIDELFDAYGFTFSQNFFLKEKQFSGIQFEWRFVRSWGFFWNIGYDDNGMYVGARDIFFQNIAQYAHQAANYTLAAVSRILTGRLLLPVESHVIDESLLYIDELAFEKQLYVNSDDVRVENARTEFKQLTHETDYLNAKAHANGLKERRKFVNQEWHTKAHGDVRMRLGRSFIVAGSRVPEKTEGFLPWNNLATYEVGDKVESVGIRYTSKSRNSFAFPSTNPSDWLPFIWDLGTNYEKGQKVEYIGIIYQSRVTPNTGRFPAFNPEYWQNLNKMVCSEVKHIIDNDGYYMDILGVRKFIVDL